ncbi:mycofactocin precursor MftA [Yinghuangia sp. YIM S10712]|uniref:mycofactocin precursor MftA n=1 Tax=Yinghuangia sp. YIM S10712 TaxID=3436930 RepID=UPI003F53DA73
MNAVVVEAEVLDAASPAAETARTAETPDTSAADAAAEETLAESLIEDVSIDGMCGVY